jgi:AraC-like DNA-binding protein
MVIPIVLPIPVGLENIIDSLWFANGKPGDPLRQSLITMADGCPGLIFQDPAYGTMSVASKTLPPVYLYGQASEAAELIIDGKLRAIGICFKPSALLKVFGLGANELTDSCIGIEELPKYKGNKISDVLIDATTVNERVQLLTSYVTDQRSLHEHFTDPATESAIREIVHLHGDISLPHLRQRLSMSERTLERKFQQHVGISPRLFAKICRFQESIRQLRDGDFVKLSDIAYTNGFADQSHFIRNFKTFAGCLPNQYKNRSVRLIDSVPASAVYDLPA